MSDAQQILDSIFAGKIDLGYSSWDEVQPLFKNLSDAYIRQAEILLENELSSSFAFISECIHIMYGIAKHYETTSAYSIYASFSRALSLISTRYDLLGHFIVPAHDKALNKSISGKIVYIFDNDSWLGHVQIFSSYVSACSLKDFFVIIRYKSDPSNRFVDILSDLKIPFHFLGRNESDPDGNPVNLLKFLHDLDVVKSCKAYIWVGFPPLQSVGGLQKFSTSNLAWQFKYYHPLSINHDFTFFGYALEDQVGRKVFHPSSYNPVIFSPHLLDLGSLCDDDSNSSESDIIAFDAIDKWKKSGGKVLACICRPEKIYSSLDFLETLSLILETNKDMIFCCTVRSKNDANLIKAKISRINPIVKKQLYFVQWTKKVDKFLELSDVFIDTYPFGCGITLIQAMKHSCLTLIPVLNKQKFIDIQENPSLIINDLRENNPHLRHIAYNVSKQLAHNSMIHFFESKNFSSFDLSVLRKYFEESSETKNLIALRREHILKKLLGNYDKMSELIYSVLND